MINIIVIKILKKLKKSYFKLIFLLLSFIFIISNSNGYSIENCPFGEVNDSFPGHCGRYVDTNFDDICDLSQTISEYGNNFEENGNKSNISGNVDTKSESNSRINYYFIPIALILLVIYLTTFSLSKIKKIKTFQHRKIWNFTLLITFLISGVFGIILAITISYGIRLNFYSDLLFWHVEMGISMAIISIFHILWHLKYFKKMYNFKKS